MRFKILISFVMLYLLPCYGWDGMDLVKQDKNCRENYNNFSKEIAKSCQLELLCGDGTGSLVEDKRACWCSKFMIKSKPLTIDELRSIFHAAVPFLWKNVNKDKAFAKYLFSESQHREEKRTLSINNIGIRIDLWDANFDRYLYPYVSQVQFKGGKIHYYYADPKTQALQKPGFIEDLPSWVLEIN